jgi:2'-5' RNA ligase
LEKSGLFEGKLAERENLHLTLKFLGDISEEQAEKVKEMLGKVKFGKFSVKLANVGVFDKKIIRIIWVALEAKELFDVQKEIDNSLKDLFAEEERFMGHVTIARPKFVKDKEKLIGKLKSLKVSDKSYAIDKISFKRSELTKSGPIYENLLVIEGK